MDKRAVADIQADMGGRGAVAAVGSVEEHEVARLEIALRDGRTVAQLTVRAVGQAVAELCVDVHREAGAVEPAGGCAAVDIADAEIALALSNEIRTGAAAAARGAAARKRRAALAAARRGRAALAAARRGRAAGGSRRDGRGLEIGRASCRERV